MRTTTITTGNEGQRVDKFLLKLLPGMSKSFCYKMFRKKNITLNNRKIQGNELLKVHDVIQVFFSDETYDKFRSAHETQVNVETPLPKVIYEDDFILVLNKEDGVFSQPDPRGISIIDQIKRHYEVTGYQLSEGFIPGVANRLDRNTSGVIISGKTLPAIQAINKLVMDRQVDKRYRTIVLGQLDVIKDLKGYLSKNCNRNRSVLVDSAEEGDFIHTVVTPLRLAHGFTEVEVEIHTGKSHQIRAHLSGIGHPIIGDGKYGDHKTNQWLKRQYGLTHQLLHAHIYQMKGEDEMTQRYKEPFVAQLPELYLKIAEGLFNG